MNRFLIASALLGFACAVSAQTATAEADAAVQHDNMRHDSMHHDNKLKAQAAADAKVDRFCIQQTGTRIPVARKASSEQDQKRCVAGRGRVYTRDDINATGRVDLADALRALDPSIR